MDNEAPVPTPVGFMSHTQGGSTSLFYTGIFMPVFSIPIVLLRLWTSQHVVNKWRKDDTLIVIATTLVLLQSVLQLDSEVAIMFTTSHQRNFAFCLI
ncbi:hypothetical protein CDV36_004738 [Fusarium kuroshium]|uniref:Uncharacterized protein n=2 Tax=Fusarium solani species complex TaxID=232080 RepID=A0A3M2SDC0_9HYPO|nr:hypothetical protein CDV36_004738 [Fusarium kuroshium]RSM09900.1 hypothetical protein CEP52_003860 [Fusarium oligoseptatum]